MKYLLAAAGLAATLLAVPAVAAGNAEAGAAKALACIGCHGANGNSTIVPELPYTPPNIAAQGPVYIAAQLKLFKEGVRTNPFMMGSAAALTPEDMLDLAAHFSTQALTGLEADPALVPVGQKLFRFGDPARNIPACTGCHGPDGKGVDVSRYPSVRSQHSAYSYIQLKAFASGERKPVAGNEQMQQIAARLTDDEMKALASYAQGLR